jgi:FKBP-type peptidyl-prolyl cis-trans isomerase SlyD
MAAQRVENSKVVSLTYSIVDDDGELLELSDIPISYVHGGEHDLFEKVVHELEGCVIDDSVDVSLTPEEGFGPHDPALTYTDDIDNVPPEFRHVGAEVEMMNDKGEAKTFVVTRIEDGKLTVDGNHPMAGKVITFQIRVVDIRDATPEEMIKGIAAMQAPVLH